MELNGLPNFSVYLWGRQLRQDLMYCINNTIAKLNEIKNEIEENNYTLEQIEIGFTIVDAGLLAIQAFLTYTNVNNQIVNKVLTILDIAVFATQVIFGIIFPEQSTDDIDSLILYLTGLKGSLEYSDVTSDAEIIVFHLQNIVYEDTLNYKFSNEFVNISTRHSLNHLYSGSYIYDICEFSNGNGGYYKVYGEVEMGNPNVDLGTYFNV